MTSQSCAVRSVVGALISELVIGEEPVMKFALPEAPLLIAHFCVSGLPAALLHMGLCLVLHIQTYKA